jgi:hypothetical protein
VDGYPREEKKKRKEEKKLAFNDNVESRKTIMSNLPKKICKKSRKEILIDNVLTNRINYVAYLSSYVDCVHVSNRDVCQCL